MRILVVEDEATLRRQLVQAIAAAGHTVEEAADGEQAHYLGDVESFDAAVLDLGLPGMDGLTVLRHWRSVGRDMPVLILTARSAWHEKVAGIDAGADDYLAKPFHMEELLARLRALLRRAGAHTSAEWRCGPILLDTRQARVLVAGSSWANPELLPDPLKAAGFSVVFTQDADAKEDPSDSEISAWVRQAANVDTVIFASYAPGAQQFKAIDALVATGKQVIVINTSLPYPLARYSGGGAGPQVVAEIYANNSVALAAAVDVLSGKVNAVGKLPVSVPGASGVAYARGFGLSYGSASATATATTPVATALATPALAATCGAIPTAKSTTKPSASLKAAPSSSQSPKRGLAHSGVETGLFAAFALALLGGGLALRSRTR